MDCLRNCSWFDYQTAYFQLNLYFYIDKCENKGNLSACLKYRASVLSPTAIGYNVGFPGLSQDTTLWDPNIGFSDWSERLAPLESDVAGVGGECETVNSLNLLRVEAEILKINCSVSERTELNDSSVHQKQASVLSQKVHIEAWERKLLLFNGRSVL